VQRKLLREALDAHPDLDHIVGTSVTAEAADRVLGRLKLSEKVSVVAYYFSPDVHKALVRGKVKASPSDSPVIQARISVDQIVRILESKEVRRHVGTRVELITSENVAGMNKLNALTPVGFFPTYTVE